MTSVFVLCNHTGRNTISSTGNYDQILSINPTPPEQNLQLHIDNITHRILEELSPLAQDLLEIATYVYYADCSVKRITDVDVYADRWRRRLEFAIPVSDPDTWNKPEIKTLLQRTLEFLSGDDLFFTFYPPKPRPAQLHFSFPDIPPPFPDANCISLFSGGLDGLVGCLYLLKEQNESPLLVSHRSLPKMDALQKKLVYNIRMRNKEWGFPHLSIWINRKGERAVETTQRTRSFLYLSIAVAAAKQLNINRVYVSENGVISVNIPISTQNVGTLLTRSTHPKFLMMFQELIQKLFASDITIHNPFIFSTKTYMLKKLETWNQSDLIPATVSCSYTQGRTKMHPQCGTCSQCVNRRFSAIAAGLEKHDKSDNYERDIFLDSLDEGRETAYAEGYVRTALQINKMNDIQFFARYPELDEVVGYLDLSANESGQKIYQLFQDHAKEVIYVATAKLTEYQKDLIDGSLPDNCLTSMLASRHHLQNPLDAYAEKVARILSRALRLNFQSEKPNKESRLQESAQASLVAAKERLARESPMLSYSAVQTKPDFANITDFDRILFVELKLLNNRGKLNRIVTEITSRILIYRDQGAFVLFVVYDTNDFIHDDEDFVSDFERHERIRVVVVR